MSFHFRYFSKGEMRSQESKSVNGMKILRQVGRIPHAGFTQDALYTSEEIQEMRASIALVSTTQTAPAIWTIVLLCDKPRSIGFDTMLMQMTPIKLRKSPLIGFSMLLRVIDITLGELDWVYPWWGGALRDFKVVLETLEDALRVPVSYDTFRTDVVTRLTGSYSGKHGYR